MYAVFCSGMLQPFLHAFIRCTLSLRWSDSEERKPTPYFVFPFPQLRGNVNEVEMKEREAGKREY